MLVGAGIGVTPFASIIRSLVLKAEQAKRQARRGSVQRAVQTHFFWLCRNREEFDSFRDLMKCKSADRKDFHFNLYLSGETEVTDKDFNRELEGFKKWSSLFTGRPNWRRIFGELRKAHKGEEIGVFFCGPGPIALQLKQNCKKFSDPKPSHGRAEDDGDEPRTSFDFHMENF